EHSLNTAIKKLRQALSDDKKNPRFVETLPKRGYRFIGALQQSKAAETAGPLLLHSTRVGQVTRLASDGKLPFTLVSIEEEAALERERLDAGDDDVGVSLLIASQRLLMVRHGTPVRILEIRDAANRCQVRILEGEHYGKTAFVPFNLLDESNKIDSQRRDETDAV